ncbi:MAG: glycosyltransferase family 4 protein [Flavobacteriales bacterium]|nr:glycosyltransferase family 4 protein [Flavobacteriales bacterium]
MKRVLLITYYWPPNGGAPVQRWLKFARFLPALGWQPVVYTPSNPDLVMEDPGLAAEVPHEAEVIRTPIREPYGLYRALTGRRGQKVHAGFLNEGRRRESMLDKLAVFLRGNLFIPDARVGWVRPSVRFLLNYLRENPVDAIVSTGPPHSMHLIARALKRHTGLPWLADFRDPWTNIDFYHQLRLTRWADRRHRALERGVLHEADATVAVGWTLAEELRVLGARRVEVITNGFDRADLPEPPAPVDETFSLVHVGSMNAARDVPLVWNGLAELVRADEEVARRLVIRFVGAVDHQVLQSIEQAGLAKHVERIGTVDHARAMCEIQRARVLLLSLNDAPNAKGILTSKLFEYLATGRPILAVGPADGDAARVLRGTGHLLLDRNDHVPLDRLKQLLSQTVSVTSELGMYDRRELTSSLADLLEQLTTPSR